MRLWDGKWYGTGSAERPVHRSCGHMTYAQVAPRSPYRTGDRATTSYTQSQSDLVFPKDRIEGVKANCHVALPFLRSAAKRCRLSPFAPVVKATVRSRPERSVFRLPATCSLSERRDTVVDRHDSKSQSRRAPVVVLRALPCQPQSDRRHFALIASLRMRPTQLLGVSILSSAASVGAMSAGLASE
jgi:hypothetical protein